MQKLGEYLMHRQGRESPKRIGDGGRIRRYGKNNTKKTS